MGPGKGPPMQAGCTAASSPRVSCLCSVGAAGPCVLDFLLLKPRGGWDGPGLQWIPPFCPSLSSTARLWGTRVMGCSFISTGSLESRTGDVCWVRGDRLREGDREIGDRSLASRLADSGSVRLSGVRWILLSHFGLQALLPTPSCTGSLESYPCLCARPGSRHWSNLARRGSRLWSNLPSEKFYSS